MQIPSLLIAIDIFPVHSTIILNDISSPTLTTIVIRSTVIFILGITVASLVSAIIAVVSMVGTTMAVIGHLAVFLAMINRGKNTMPFNIITIIASVSIKSAEASVSLPWILLSSASSLSPTNWYYHMYTTSAGKVCYVLQYRDRCPVVSGVVAVMVLFAPSSLSSTTLASASVPAHRGG